MCVTINGWGGFWLGLAIVIVFKIIFDTIDYAIKVRGIKHLTSALTNDAVVDMLLKRTDEKDDKKD